MSYSKEILDAFKIAQKAKSHTYSPYSKFPVGAALKLKSQDEVFMGCNVENASYGATICAERSAIVAAVSKYGRSEFEYLVVTANTKNEVQPCALCLQVLAEFCSEDFPIYLANKDEIKRKVELKDLLPNPFKAIPETK